MALNVLGKDEKIGITLWWQRKENTNRIHLQCRRPGFNPWVRKIPWRRERLPILVFWPGEFHGLYSPWGYKELDTTERLSLFRVLIGVCSAIYHKHFTSMWKPLWATCITMEQGGYSAISIHTCLSCFSLLLSLSFLFSVKSKAFIIFHYLPSSSGLLKLPCSCFIPMPLLMWLHWGFLFLPSVFSRSTVFVLCQLYNSTSFHFQVS